MAKLVDLIPDPHFRSRILNALWRELHPDRMPAERPDDWEPDHEGVSAIKLEHVIGLGPRSRVVVNVWLRANGGEHGE